MADYERFEELKDKIRVDPYNLRAWREIATMVSTPEDFDNVVFVINRISLRNKLRVFAATALLLGGFAFVSFCWSLDPAFDNANERVSGISFLLSCIFFPMIVFYTISASGLFPTEVEIFNDVLRTKTTKEVYEHALAYLGLFRRGTIIQLIFESAMVLLIWSMLCGGIYLPNESVESSVGIMIFNMLLCLLPLVAVYFLVRSYQAGIYKKPAAKPEFVSDNLRIPFRVTRSGEILELPSSPKKLTPVNF